MVCDDTQSTTHLRNSAFVQKTWNARKKRCVTGSAENAFICNVVFVFNQSGQRNKMPYHRMSNRDRYEAVGMLRGMSVNDVAAHFNLNRSTIFRLKRKLNQTGDGVDLQRTGRPRKTSAAEDRHLRTLHLRNRFRSASETARNWAGNERISLRTVLRRLKNAGLRSRRPVQKQVLNKRRQTRMGNSSSEADTDAVVKNYLVS